MANRPKYSSPIGILGYPCAIQEPDTSYADEKDPNDLGAYKARLVLPKDSTEARQFLATLEDIWQQYAAEEMTRSGKKKLSVDPDSGMPWTDELDRETQEPTGNIIFRAKLKARVVKKDGTFFEQRPKVFDTSNKLIVEVPAVGPGSKVRLGGHVHCWHTSKAGMSLWLEAIQLHELVERGGNRSAEDYGFDMADGYTTAGGGSEDGDEDVKGDF